MLDRPSFEKAGMLPLLRKATTGQKVSEGIKAAPPRTALKMFGGPLTIDQFRRDACTLQTCYQELPSNVILDTPVLTLVPNGTPALGPRGRAEHNQRMLNFDDLTPGARNETLRLRRPKPIKSKADNTMLEKIFGISS
jgi:hypothetical protein